MVVRITVTRELLEWACHRDGQTVEDVHKDNLRVLDWINGKDKPTLRQLEVFARRTHTPIGLLLLSSPPRVELPIPDFRTHGNRAVREPSTELLDTIYDCQSRQAWYRDYAISNGLEPPSYVGSMGLDDEPTAVGSLIRRRLQIDEEPEKPRSWEEARKLLIRHVEAAGILVNVNGNVGNNTHRPLNLEEFRGFALVDKHAPLVFVNSHDSRAAQIFTLAHEVAHIWLGIGGLDDAHDESLSQNKREGWCNQVAAELLVPGDRLRHALTGAEDPFEWVPDLAREFRVSTLAVIRRIPEVLDVSMEEMWHAYRAEKERIAHLDAKKREGDGGNFYANLSQKVSPRLASAVIRSTANGDTSHREAYRLLGVKGDAPFRGFAQYLGAAR